jgi:hypothetical protein
VIMNGTLCSRDAVVLEHDGCVAGAPHFDPDVTPERAGCANHVTPREDYCSYSIDSIGAAACARCSTATGDGWLLGVSLKAALVFLISDLISGPVWADQAEFMFEHVRKCSAQQRHNEGSFVMRNTSAATHMSNSRGTSFHSGSCS